ncbi:MAG: ABC transporter ATP-binding protein [Deltaproteobacteria bacterium]|uniref:ABC transporter ATP-binding protein n=1 Tax=Candidatus Zymogenus saltonus TaxID=2844893 RepID=A0A9D8KGA5_9DELT|nr:ABC transporter ATP-binding protein [Candidatus Zymogenus saltonus]
MPILKVKELSISFGGLRALKGVSFEVKEGGIFSIIGPNGAGKTTIFNCIGGQCRPDFGTIRFRDRDITGFRPHQVARLKIARSFQNMGLFPRMTVLENVLVGRHIHTAGGIFRSMLTLNRRCAKEEIAQRKAADGIIDLLNLISVRDKPAGGLPYGTKKTVELARAMAMEPELLLLDEPSGGMNVREREELKHRIKDIAVSKDITVVVVEHDMNLVMDISDEVLAVNFGEKIAQGTPEEIQRNPEVVRAYLGEEARI